MKKKKLYSMKHGFLGVFTPEEGEELMNEIGGIFKWNEPVSVNDVVG